MDGWMDGWLDDENMNASERRESEPTKRLARNKMVGLCPNRNEAVVPSALMLLLLLLLLLLLRILASMSWIISVHMAQAIRPWIGSLGPASQYSCIS